MGSIADTAVDPEPKADGGAEPFISLGPVSTAVTDAEPEILSRGSLAHVLFSASMNSGSSSSSSLGLAFLDAGGPSTAGLVPFRNPKESDGRTFGGLIWGPEGSPKLGCEAEDCKAKDCEVWSCEA